MIFVKKIFSFICGVLLFVAPVLKVSADVEMWTFNDGTRVSRFKYTDIDIMIALYENFVKENNKHLISTGKNVALKITGIGVGICALLGGGSLIYDFINSEDKDSSLGEKLGAGALILSGLASIIGSFYPEYVSHNVKKLNTSGISEDELKEERHLWLGVEDICNILKIMKNELNELKEKGVEKSVPYGKQKTFISEIGLGGLLKWEDIEAHPYYILVERPKSVYDKKYKAYIWNHLFAGYRFHSYSSGKDDPTMNSELRAVMIDLKNHEKLTVVKKDIIKNVNQGEIEYGNSPKDK